MKKKTKKQPQTSYLVCVIISTFFGFVIGTSVPDNSLMFGRSQLKVGTCVSTGLSVQKIIGIKKDKYVTRTIYANGYSSTMVDSAYFSYIESLPIVNCETLEFIK